MRGFRTTALAVVTLGGLLAALIWRQVAPQPAPEPAPSARTAPVTIATVPPRARAREAPTPPPTAAPEEPVASGVPTEPLAAVVPSPSAEPTPVESLDDQRTRASEALDQRLQQLAPRVESFRVRLRHYENGCRSGGGPWPPSGCEVARTDLQQRLAELRSAVETADEQARRSAVYPGVRAEIRRRHGLDEDAWDALLRSALATLE
jgi:hypothetical protein